MSLDFWTKNSCEEVGNEVGVWLNNSFGWLVRLIETYSNRGKRPVQHGRPGLGGRVWTFVRSSKIKKNSQFFQFHSLPIVTASGLSRFVKKVKVFPIFEISRQNNQLLFVLQNSQSIPWLNEKIRPNQPQFRCPEEDPIPDVFFSMALIMEKSSVPHRTSNKKKSR